MDKKKIIKDTIEKVQDIDFSEFNESMYKVINSSLRKMTDKINSMTKNTYLSLPKTQNPDICKQNPKNTFTILVLKLVALLFAFGCIAAILNGFYLRSIIFAIAMGILGFESWTFANQLSDFDSRFKRYKLELKNKSAISVHDLAGAVNLKEKEVVKDLKKMQKKEYFKQARLVENDSLFILDIETFHAYKQEIRKNEALNYRIDENDTTNQHSHKNELFKEDAGKYIRKIDVLKNEIKNKSLVEDIIILKTTVSNIFKTVEKYPEEVYALNKLMDYYLPLTIKLLTHYHEFELNGLEDENIVSSKREIETSIKTINDAFEKILVQLYQDKAMDVHTDIDALRMVLKQEGLLRDEMDINYKGDLNE